MFIEYDHEISKHKVQHRAELLTHLVYEGDFSVLEFGYVHGYKWRFQP